MEDGDIVNIDITVYFEGYHGDLNETFLVGNVEPQYKNLIKATYDAMMHAINHGIFVIHKNKQIVFYFILFFQILK